jgi:hypothetical protein
MRAGGLRVRLLLVLAAAGVAATGCSPLWSARAGASLPPGRTLVVARPATVENRAVVESAAELVTTALRNSTEAIGVRDLFREAGAAGAAVWAPQLVDRIQRGGWPTPEEGGELLGRFRVSTLVAVEVTSYDQVWGKYAKFTRVGVGLTAFHIPAGAVIWRLHSDAEVEDKRGRAFQYAMEQAVTDVVEAIDPRWRFSLAEAWRSWRR